MRSLRHLWCGFRTGHEWWHTCYVVKEPQFDLKFLYWCKRCGFKTWNRPKVDATGEGDD